RGRVDVASKGIRVVVRQRILVRQPVLDGGPARVDEGDGLRRKLAGRLPGNRGGLSGLELFQSVGRQDLIHFSTRWCRRERVSSVSLIDAPAVGKSLG